MEYILNKDKGIIRIDKDESLFDSILQVANQEQWQAAHFSGIGALKEVELGFYQLEQKTYDRKLFKSNAELLSLEGNLCFNQGERFLHLHAILSDQNFACFGGHLFSAKVAVTCEVNVRVFDAEIERKPNSEIGLSLLTFCPV